MDNQHEKIQECEPLLPTPEWESDTERSGHRCKRFGRNHWQRRRRFIALKFAVASLLLYLVARFVILDMINVVDIIRQHRNTNADHGWLPSAFSEDHDNDGLPSHMDVTSCTAWSEPSQDPHGHKRFHSSATLELPLGSDKIFLISRGPSSVGGVSFVQAQEESDTVKITTTVEYVKKRHLNLAQFCLVEGLEGENGVGIFTHRPEHRRRRRNNHISFHVTVVIPASRIKDFETDMPFFAHWVDDLSRGVEFENVEFKSGFLPIHVQGLSASTALAHSGFSPVEGNFIVNKSLTIRTSNAPIKVNVTLQNEDEAEATSLFMETSNAHIGSNISLISTSKDSEGGAFKVTSQTSVSAILLSFPVAPSSSKLNLDVHTSLAPATVNLHPSYEGSFTLSTSLAQAHVEYNEDEKDPKDKGRKRQVVLEEVRGNGVKGSTEWEDGGKERGTVVIGSSIAPVSLYL